ncbi:MalY/PatB family protein [Enterococcus ratti]|uniref:MalY/PatB family protein n=1 Tax=Enterococcus ratti TaxID=150033 RepID=UPI0035116FDE
MLFDTVIDRKDTYCTQWDFVKDRFGEDDLLPFTISDTDFMVPNEVLETLTKRMKHPIFGYTRWNHDELKKAIQQWYQIRFDAIIEKEWIMYTPTVIYAASAFIQLLSKKGEGVVLQTPAYDAFFKVIQDNGRQVVENQLIYENNCYSIDFINLEKQLAQPENKLLLLCSPHNPTGRAWSQQELEKIVALCQKYTVFLLSDEIHMDILSKGQRHLPATSFHYEKTAVITSGTKTFNFPSLSFAYTLIPNLQLRKAFHQKLKNADGLSSPNIFGMLATMSAYQHCAYWVDELNQYLEKNQQYVKTFIQKNLPRIKIVDREATYLMWLDISEIVSDISILQKKLVSTGKVAIMDGTIYGGNGTQFLRLNIGCPISKLEDGLNRMLKGIKAIKENEGFH